MGTVGTTYFGKVLRQKTTKKQTWIVKIDPSDGTFLFESTYWARGNYLSGKLNDWLYVYHNYRENWWKVTPSRI